MNLNTTSFSSKQMSEGIIVSYDQFQTVTTLYIVTATTLAFFGSLTNMFNIKTFAALGLKDGVSVSLFALSVTDLLYCMASFTFASTWAFLQMESRHGLVFPINPFVFTMFSADIGLSIYSATTLNTMFLAVARCMCVAKPLHFKNVFTRSRSIFIHISFIVFALACYTPVLTQMGTRKAFDRSVNKTRAVFWYSDIREHIKDIVFLVHDMIFTFATQFIIIVCVVVMVERLRRSATFRHGISKATMDDDDNESGYKLSGKELQVVKQVVLISTMYIICSLPKMCNAVYSLVDPDLDVGKRQQYFYLSLTFMRNICEILNSASTFFVYYIFNSAFRSRWSAEATSKPTKK